jgi:hypothetical protein
MIAFLWENFMTFTERVKRKLFKLLARTQPNLVYISQEGFCPCCDSQVIFSSSSTHLRERFQCSNCRCVPRERVIMSVIKETLPDWR